MDAQEKGKVALNEYAWVPPGLSLDQVRCQDSPPQRAATKPDHSRPNLTGCQDVIIVALMIVPCIWHK